MQIKRSGVSVTVSPSSSPHPMGDTWAPFQKILNFDVFTLSKIVHFNNPFQFHLMIWRGGGGGEIFKPWWTKVMADRWIDEESSQGHDTPSLTVQLSVVFIFFSNISRTFWEQATSCFKSFSSLLQFFLSTDKMIDQNA